MSTKYEREGKERKYKGYGRKITVKFRKSSPFGRKQETYHNITEIHENYNNSGRVAFESDVHFSGLTHPTHYISKIISRKENKKYREM